MSITLVVNPGSSSKKYALYRDGEVVLEMAFEGTTAGYEVCTRKIGTQQTCESVSQADFQSALTTVAHAVKTYTEVEQITLSSISFRVVAPGGVFQRHSIIDDAYLAVLKGRESSAPLHIPIIVREIEACRELFPNIKLVAASDSAFHASLPFVAREFSITRADAEVLDVHRFGYHGLSVASVVHRVHSVTGHDSESMVVCHIGSGVSVSAVKNGVSIETSMGYSPVSGVPMGSRASDLDPGAIIEIMRSKNLKPSEMSVYINSSGGLAGLSGDGDIRRLLDRRVKGDMVATQTLDLFIYRIQKLIVASTVPLGGIDTLVLTGTAAFRSAELRAMIVKNLGYLGLELDHDRNDVLVGKEGVISGHNQPVKIVVMRTDEMREMARVAERLVV